LSDSYESSESLVLVGPAFVCALVVGWLVQRRSLEDGIVAQLAANVTGVLLGELLFVLGAPACSIEGCSIGSSALLGGHVVISGHPEGRLKKWTDGIVCGIQGATRQPHPLQGHRGRHVSDLMGDPTATTAAKLYVGQFQYDEGWTQ
jgi:hypothetical protein